MMWSNRFFLIMIIFPLFFGASLHTGMLANNLDTITAVEVIQDSDNKPQSGVEKLPAKQSENIENSKFAEYDYAKPAKFFSYDDSIKNIELTLIMFGFLITFSVAIGSIVIPIIITSKSNKREEDLKDRFSQSEQILSEKQMLFEKSINNTFDINRFQNGINAFLTESKMQLGQEFDSLKSDISASVAEKKISEMVNTTVEKLFDEHYKHEIFRTSFNYNKLVLGQTSDLKDLQVSIMRRFSAQFLKFINPPNPDKLKKALDNCIQDNHLLSKIFSGDYEMRKEALIEYARSHPFNELLPVLDDLLKEYNQDTDMFNIIIEAKEAAKKFNESDLF